MCSKKSELTAEEAKELRELINALEEENAVFQHRILELMAYMEEMTTARVALEKELEALHATRLMRATEPIRRAYAKMRRKSR